MKIFKLFCTLLLSVSILSCSTPKGQAVEGPSDLTVTCNPEVLEAIQGKVNVALTMNFPAGYLHSYGMMTVTPVIVYEGGQRTGDVFLLQGDRVKANYLVVSSKGGKITRNLSFDFVPGMEQSYLELRCVAIMNEKKIDLPAIKVADGCRATYQMVADDGEFDFMPDGYQEVLHLSQETSIFYDVNSASMQNSGRNRQAVSEGKMFLNEIRADERATVTSTEIIAYASPEGGEEYNAELSDRRAKSAEKTWASMTAGVPADSMSVLSVGQDWEGFQEAISRSNIEDKDLILRVLSMYSDPASREEEIKNMAHIYEEIAEKVFPELRRASFIVNSDYRNYSDEELTRIAQTSVFGLDEEQILRLATIEQDRATKKLYYRIAAEKFGSTAGFFNMAVMEVQDGTFEVATGHLKGLPESPDVINLLGVIEMRRGHLDAAWDLFEVSESEFASANKGTILIKKGEYAAAADTLKGQGTYNEALACILCERYDDAATALGSADDPYSSYLQAIVAARKGNAAKAKEWLAKAEEDENLKARAAKDVEFVACR